MKAKNILIGIGVVTGIAIIYNAIQRKRNTPPVFYKKKLLNNYNARTIPPFGIYIKDSEKENKELLNHELIHWKQ